MSDKTNGDIALESLDNCWFALCRFMSDHPTQEVQYTMNLLGRIVTEAKCRAERTRKNTPKQISIEEWMEWLKKEM